VTPHTIAIMTIAFIAVALLSGGGVYWALGCLNKIRKRDAENDAEEILLRAKNDAEAFRREAEIELKERSMKQKEELEKEKRAVRTEQTEKERLLDKRQETLDQQSEDLRKQERELQTSRAVLKLKLEEQDKLTKILKEKVVAQDRALYEVLNLSREEAKRRLLAKLDKELTEEEGAIILRHEKNITEHCEEQARNTLLLALQRYAAAHTAEATTSTVDIPNDDMKGRVIGREGRNIRAFEKITGVDVIIDDTPGVVIVSAFDAIRRESARLTLTRLIADGRIHPSRIEEIYTQSHAEIQNFIQHAGEEACQEVEVHGLHERIVSLLGRLYFRTSYSQNVLRHSIEVAFLAGALAAELKLDERLARRCGLLHDLGKAVDHEIEGGHPKIGADILKRYGEPIEVVQAALNHHEDPRIASPYTTIVAAADACSASRPGARRETLERYVKRMEELEQIAREYPCVEQAFAVQAGREMRVLVNSQLTTDESAAKLCRDIVTALKERLLFPGEIKVTVIRETRTTEIAK